MKILKYTALAALIVIAVVLVLGTINVPAQVTTLASYVPNESVSVPTRCPTAQESILALLKRRFRIP